MVSLREPREAVTDATGSCVSGNASICLSLRIQICPKISGFPLYFYSRDGIETINPTLGRGMDP